MTRKDYELIAMAIRNSTRFFKQEAPLMAIRVTARCIADVLQRDNVRFDRELFLKDCGVES